MTLNGSELDPITLVEDPTVAVEDYCRNADLDRAWAGRVVVEVP